MDSVQTLHDFALNLLNDPTALAAFGTDPQGALAAAGLGDVSAADVHEVIPLVLDFVPVDSLPAVDSLPQLGGLSSFGTDAPQAGIQGAIDQLTALTAGLGLPATPELPGVGDLGVGELPAVGQLPAVGALPGVNDVTNAANATALAGNVTGAILGGDLASGLDSAALTNLTAAPAYLTDPASGVSAGAVDQATHVAAFGTAETQQVLAISNAEVHDVTSNVTDVTDGLGVSDAVNNLTGHIGDFSGVLQGAGESAHSAGGHGHNPLHEVTNVVTNATGLDVDHNAVGQVTGAVGDIASGNGSAVHDVVSDVSDVSHNALGNLHIGDIASNDIHLGH
ncbi:IniB N-terminal domain-containing protein [Amycolatopsis sp. OK19-0408]|uniref:IniB N-terminal domain-containing protein n=1 Tax=Amycolatopsis iheyensis TaxID=2945988 RepID=A0A9X2SR93_9PSEU|nr:IniB N-terminal domain-containing protein [Amycolatopsis iheyensis]MCR6490181.1 IniB N-terminal domain-containing protein [Amycolatopsis iheyensis]